MMRIRIRATPPPAAIIMMMLVSSPDDLLSLGVGAAHEDDPEQESNTHETYLNNMVTLTQACKG